MEINEALKQAICKHTLLDISEQELTIPCDLIGDLGINSIDLIMIIIELEEVLQISIDEEDLIKMVSLNLYLKHDQDLYSSTIIVSD